MSVIKVISESIGHLLFPTYCTGCGDALPAGQDLFCIQCLQQLPRTGFVSIADNPVKRKFAGRLAVINACSAFYFTTGSRLEKAVYRLKYRGDRRVGVSLGRLLGQELWAAAWIKDIDAVVPLPLHSARQRMRGYNQSEELAKGVAEVCRLPIMSDCVIRQHFTETQTQKSRQDRMQNMENVFHLQYADAVSGKHLLLIDDVITTGATLDFCGNEILKAKNVRLSIATLGLTFH